MEYDIEVETFQRQALEISEPDENFNPNAVPQTGEEYLTHMLYERKRCPAIVVRRPMTDEVNVNISLNVRTIEMDTENEMPSTHSNHLPTIEWKNLQIGDFLDMRERINALREHIQSQNYDISLEPPLTTESDEWQTFCRNNKPLLRTILRLNQRILEQLLELIAEWLNADQEIVEDDATMANNTTATPTPVCASSSSSAAANGCNVNTFDLSCSDHWLGSWLYAVLACLHLPIEPTVHSTLRDIARSCMRLRSQLLPQEMEKAVPYNLFIYIIAKAFGQLDLAQFV